MTSKRPTLVLALILLSTLYTLAHAQWFAPDPFKNNRNQDPGAPGPDAVHISKIAVLTLNKNQYTTHKRTSAVPQLKCVGGSARGQYSPTTVQCINKGSDGTSVNWKCDAEMSKKYSFGRLNVQCEGYRYAGDEWVLKGSCGLEYELEYSGKGRNNKYDRAPLYAENEEGSALSVFTIIALVLLVVFIYRCCIAGPSTDSTFRPTSTSSSSSHPNMYPNASAPPFNPDYMASNSHQNKYTPYTQHETSTNSGPGFWTGAAVGSAAGFMAGRHTAPRTESTWTNHSSHTSYDDDSDTRETSGFATTSSR
ncbi:hypothetical protein AKO1_012456 [Acrasis kona]|uniref:Store-operated calcium entry-associated regulatory factor n=1 Tax=Acrasis kona TaxID=1008807 RepID=A0AAW2YXT5_9EUKA